MSLVKNTSVYFFANILNAAIPFILLPILTRYLDVEEYGQLAMFQALVSGLGTFIGLNAIGAANRKFYDNDTTGAVLRKFNGACFQILIISSVAICVFGGLFERTLSGFLTIPSSWMFAAVLVSIFGFIINMRLGQWQIRSQAKYYGCLQISSSLINMLLSLLFVTVLAQGVHGRINGLVIAGAVSAIIALIYLYRDNLLQLMVWEPEYIKEALAFGVPLIPHSFGFFLISVVDRFVINDKLGLSETGSYMVALQLSGSLAIIFDAINKAYVPWLFEKLNRNNITEKRKIVEYTYSYLLSLLLLALISFFVGPYFITLIAGSEYSKAGSVIGLLCLGQVFGGMYLMVTNYVFFAKRTGKLALVTIASGMLNLTLLMLLVDDYGLTGAAMAFVIAKFFQFIGTWFIASKYVSMSWRLVLKPH